MKKVHVALFAASLLVLADAGTAQADDHATTAAPAVVEDTAAPVDDAAPAAPEGVVATEAAPEAVPADGTVVTTDDDKGEHTEGHTDEVKPTQE